MLSKPLVSNGLNPHPYNKRVAQAHRERSGGGGGSKDAEGPPASEAEVIAALREGFARTEVTRRCRLTSG